ncbi:hypothetical protein P389DRAFT_210095 [Cystobasidium minutum MCA 4210]|uniref:uncharacterized protein n=1 Tax=Cystobasidium minutum MCA 4210 TaxID=1397322 RepID=UPI0034CF0E96|eukprot:jgi/Rhomi1/210095/estExt_Genemark1.C_3_t20301
MLPRTKAWLKRQHDQHKACVFETIREYVDFNKKLDKKQFLKTIFKVKYWGWWALLGIVIGLSVALSVYHDRIVLAIRPVADKIVSTPGAWAVPVAALIVVSIPPLIGHEIIILIAGVLWGLWWGFLIATAGTFFGEILTYYLFKYTLRERAKKIEEKSRLYAGLAHVMRKDGLWMICLVRFSAIPGHVTTCIQSTIGISVWIFGIACAISLPKQLALVYLGVLFGQSNKLAEEGKSSEEFDDAAASNATHKVVSWTVLCVTGFLTVVAMYIIWFRMWQEEKRAAALALESAPSSTNSESKEELRELENGMQYTLPYLDAANRERAPSNASTSGSSLPTIHKAGRPQVGRSRSSTLTSFAFSNNSLPYLPYTPMLDVPSSNLPIQGRNLPSPVPSAVVSFPSNAAEEESRDYLEDDRSTISSGGASRPYAPISGSTSQASTAPNSELSVRARRIRLQRSSSNLLLRPPSGEISLAPNSGNGDAAPRIYGSDETTFPPSPPPVIRQMERAASSTGRQRARSRTNSNLGPSRDLSVDASSYKAAARAHPLSEDSKDRTAES